MAAKSYKFAFAPISAHPGTYRKAAADPYVLVLSLIRAGAITYKKVAADTYVLVLSRICAGTNMYKQLAADTYVSVCAAIRAVQHLCVFVPAKKGCIYVPLLVCYFSVRPDKPRRLLQHLELCVGI